MKSNRNIEVNPIEGSINLILKNITEHSNKVTIKLFEESDQMKDSDSDHD